MWCSRHCCGTASTCSVTQTHRNASFSWHTFLQLILRAELFHKTCDADPFWKTTGGVKCLTSAGGDYVSTHSRFSRSSEIQTQDFRAPNITDSSWWSGTTCSTIVSLLQGSALGSGLQASLCGPHMFLIPEWVLYNPDSFHSSKQHAFLSLKTPAFPQMWVLSSLWWKVQVKVGVQIQ